MTSSPCSTPSARMAIYSESVPFAHETQCFSPLAAANSSSNLCTNGPRMNAEVRMTSAMAASIPALMPWYWAWRSAKGTVTSLLLPMAIPLFPGWVEPAQQARGVAGIDAGDVDVSRDHGAGADHHVVADAHRQNRRVGADRHARADAGRLPQFAPPLRGSAAGEGVVDEHDTVRDHAVLADLHQLADERVGLHFRARSDRDALLDLDERTDEDIIREPAAVQIGRLDDRHVAAERHVHEGRLPDAGLAHARAPRRHRLGRKRSATSLPVSIDSYMALMSSRLLRPSRPSTSCSPPLRVQSTTCS